MTKMICRICANSEDNKEFRIREMMFGFRDEFVYFECSKCGCLQIAEIPTDMEKCYPPNYYSLQEIQEHGPGNFMIRFLVTSRDRYELFHKGFLGKLLCKVYPNDVLKPIAKAGINLESRILDVGCGSGWPLSLLRKVGMKNLVGLDPYMSHEVIEEGFQILKKTILDLPNDQEFDLVMFNHSLEHIPDQLETILKVSSIMARDGVCLVRIPVKTDHLFNLYGVNWVQIDAPRHFFIHTLESFNFLVNKAGLVVRDVIFDSTEFQFWGSEQCKSDIPLLGENSYLRDPTKSIFTQKQIDQFREQAQELNKINQGDQAAFYLVMKPRGM
jgi:SAM-dependent methyltransferase